MSEVVKRTVGVMRAMYPNGIPVAQYEEAFKFALFAFRAAAGGSVEDEPEEAQEAQDEAEEAHEEKAPKKRRPKRRRRWEAQEGTHAWRILDALTKAKEPITGARLAAEAGIKSTSMVQSIISYMRQRGVNVRAIRDLSTGYASYRLE